MKKKSKTKRGFSNSHARVLEWKARTERELRRTRGGDGVGDVPVGKGSGARVSAMVRRRVLIKAVVVKTRGKTVRRGTSVSSAPARVLFLRARGGRTKRENSLADSKLRRSDEIRISRRDVFAEGCGAQTQIRARRRGRFVFVALLLSCLFLFFL